MGEAIHCNKCCGEIKVKSDLIVVQEGLLGVAAYHERCYGRASKGFKSLFMSRPLNSVEGILGLVGMNILIVILISTYIRYGVSYFGPVLLLAIPLYYDFHYFLAWYFYLRHFK